MAPCGAALCKRPNGRLLPDVESASVLVQYYGTCSCFRRTRPSTRTCKHSAAYPDHYSVSVLDTSYRMCTYHTQDSRLSLLSFATRKEEIEMGKRRGAPVVIARKDKKLHKGLHLFAFMMTGGASSVVTVAKATTNAGYNARTRELQRQSEEPVATTRRWEHYTRMERAKLSYQERLRLRQDWIARGRP